MQEQLPHQRIKRCTDILISKLVKDLKIALNTLIKSPRFNSTLRSLIISLSMKLNA